MCSWVLGWHRWRRKRASEQRAYEKYIEKRAREYRNPREEDAEEWKELRRGWFLGGQEFREKLEQKLERVLKRGKRESYEREALERHDEARAEQLLKEGIACLNLRSVELTALSKSDVRKQALAWLVKTRTVAGDTWISERAGFGHRSNISRAVSRFRKSTEREVRRTKQLLLHICTD